MKKLFVMCRNNGDGSYSTRFTFNQAWIDEQQRKSDNFELTEEEYECGTGIDSEGFHYTVLNVPDECTLETLGIPYDCAEADI